MCLCISNILEIKWILYPFFKYNTRKAKLTDVRFGTILVEDDVLFTFHVHHFDGHYNVASRW
jgi:hypothetical protein